MQIEEYIDDAPRYGDVSIAVNETDHVATAEIHRPPHNFFDHQLIKDLADTFNALDTDAGCRAINARSGREIVLRRRRFQ